jgi:hypothetical protein
VQHGAAAAVNDVYSRLESSICAGTHWSLLFSQLRQFYLVTERNFFSFLPEMSDVVSFAHPVCNASFSFQYDYLDGSSFMETSFADKDYLGGLPPSGYLLDPFDSLPLIKVNTINKE